MYIIISVNRKALIKSEKVKQMKAIKGRKSYTFYDPKELYRALGTEVFSEHLEYGTLQDLYTVDEIDEMGYEEMVNEVAENTNPSQFIEDLQRQGYFLETSGIKYTGTEQGLIDENSIFDYTLSEWLEEIEEQESVSVSYNGKLIDLLFMLVDIQVSRYTNSDFFEDIDKKADYLEQEYELVFSFSDSGIEWELV